MRILITSTTATVQLQGKINDNVISVGPHEQINCVTCASNVFSWHLIALATCPEVAR